MIPPCEKCKHYDGETNQCYENMEPEGHPEGTCWVFDYTNTIIKEAKWFTPKEKKI